MLRSAELPGLAPHSGLAGPRVGAPLMLPGGVCQRHCLRHVWEPPAHPPGGLLPEAAPVDHEAALHCGHRVHELCLRPALWPHLCHAAPLHSLGEEEEEEAAPVTVHSVCCDGLSWPPSLAKAGLTAGTRGKNGFADNCRPVCIQHGHKLDAVSALHLVVTTLLICGSFTSTVPTTGRRQRPLGAHSIVTASENSTAGHTPCLVDFCALWGFPRRLSSNGRLLGRRWLNRNLGRRSRDTNDVLCAHL